ncbi:decaprenyl-diphosphate synthase subunit 1 [Acyrthosiphon pisum]|uniref:All trans-polyprenyl-diphosphate synthase PDSS1 n=1 Tax=Acyrthosiphon pisum TaxID=7029 RepID=A0A8R2B6M3_ACYPI|nr:decaprenyl-diphosphate synthase subunit 1 [Acyrthosiphon pisum]|eukprot:XP_008183822.1 PREDICTED: decaprenyl-diphosphate synthase subunit 1 [Acyrthosiphon pisum]
MASRITSGARLCVRTSIDKLVCNLSRSRHHNAVDTAAVRRGSDRILQCYQKQSNRMRSDHQRNHCRRFTTLQDTDTDSLSSIDPYRLLDDDLRDVYTDITRELELNTNQDELRTIATYYFDGQGKALRPMVAILMAHAINYHMNNNGLDKKQREVAMIAEMIHSASLIHDDVIDQSDFRRGKPSVNALWSHKKVAMAGDYILAVTSMMIARLNHNDVTITLSQIITDLVQGEFMQLGSKETENERFAHYLTKTYRKTASLIANSVKAEAMLAGADDQLVDVSFEYGRNIGLAFQLVDDLLDFVSSKDAMGKPTAADLKLGLATAPVLFACEKYPELNAMIMRRFQEPGDAERAFELVHKSQGLEQTRFLAKKHCLEATRLAGKIAESPYQKSLLVVPDLIVNRMK